MREQLESRFSPYRRPLSALRGGRRLGMPLRWCAGCCLLLLLCCLLFQHYGLIDGDVALIMLQLDRHIGAIAPVLQTDPTVADHPFGRPVDAQLPWEEDQAFRAELNRLGARNRIAAFATTLPNPLPGEDYNFARAADLLRGAVIADGEVFSMNRSIGPYSRERGFREGPIYFGSRILRGVGGGVCKMATTLYNTAILADFPIITRKNHGMLVPYANPGQDATVSYGKVDLQFKNDSGHQLLIWADTVGVTLYVAFYGQKEAPKVSWHHEILYLQERPLIRRFNPDLPPGSEQVLIEGSEGIGVRSWVTVEYPDGQTRSRNLGADWYRPMPRVVEFGPEA